MHEFGVTLCEAITLQVAFSTLKQISNLILWLKIQQVIEPGSLVLRPSACVLVSSTHQMSFSATITELGAIVCGLKERNGAHQEKVHK